MTANSRRSYGVWARSLLSPRERFLPGLGARLDRYPRFVSACLVALRRAPRGRIRGAVFRNVSGPLIRRMPTQLEVPVAGGSRMVVDTSDLIGRVLAITGTWEPQVTAAFRSLLLPGDVCIDVGANIGYFTLLASRLVGPRGHVYALEPSPASHAALGTNLDLNAITNVTALCVAAGENNGQAILHEAPGRNRGASSILPSAEDEATKVTVETRRLDSLVPADDLARARLVKIDVEGYEVEVMRTLEPVFDRGARPAVIVELSPVWSGGNAAAYCTSFCAEYDLKAYRLPRDKLLTGRPEVPFAPIELAPIELAPISDEQQELLLVPAE